MTEARRIPQVVMTQDLFGLKERKRMFVPMAQNLRFHQQPVFLEAQAVIKEALQKLEHMQSGNLFQDTCQSY